MDAFTSFTALFTTSQAEDVEIPSAPVDEEANKRDTTVYCVIA
jgi:hypothetical protein